MSTLCVTARNLHLSTCLKTEQVCLYVPVWSAMKSSVGFFCFCLFWKGRASLKNHGAAGPTRVFYRSPYKKLIVRVYPSVCAHALAGTYVFNWECVCVCVLYMCKYAKERLTRDTKREKVDLKIQSVVVLEEYSPPPPSGLLSVLLSVFCPEAP